MEMSTVHEIRWNMVAFVARTGHYQEEVIASFARAWFFGCADV